MDGEAADASEDMRQGEAGRGEIGHLEDGDPTPSAEPDQVEARADDATVEHQPPPPHAQHLQGIGNVEVQVDHVDRPGRCTTT